MNVAQHIAELGSETGEIHLDPCAFNYTKFDDGWVKGPMACYFMDALI